MMKVVLGVFFGLLGSSLVLAQDEVPGDDYFKIETLSEGLVDAMEIAVLPTGDVFIVERTGALKWYHPECGETVVVKEFDVAVLRNEKKKRFSRET